VYFAVYEGMLRFLSLVLLRCDQQLKIWRKEEDEILLFGRGNGTGRLFVV
jgi:hypothetical protein